MEVLWNVLCVWVDVISWTQDSLLYIPPGGSINSLFKSVLCWDHCMRVAVLFIKNSCFLELCFWDCYNFHKKQFVLSFYTCSQLSVGSLVLYFHLKSSRYWSNVNILLMHFLCIVSLECICLSLKFYSQCSMSCIYILHQCYNVIPHSEIVS